MLGKELTYHQWVSYLHAPGGHPHRGECEPEGWVELEDKVVLFEAKLTGSGYGKLQMEGLYKPCLEFIFRKPVVCLLVCKIKTVETPGPFFCSLEQFIHAGVPFGTWHWLGD